jgi:hypothetical protein
LCTAEVQDSVEAGASARRLESAYRPMLEERRGERYLRLDADWPRDAGLGIDVATEAAAVRLVELARRTGRRGQGPALDDLLGL